MSDKLNEEGASERVRGGVLLAHALKSKGIDTVFTLSGGFINPVLEGLMKYGINTYNTPHEQVAGHMADGWTRLSRTIAVCLVGPEGFANAVPAITEAHMARTPVLFISSSSTLKRREQGGFKEIKDYQVSAPITKYSALVPSGQRIHEFVDRAIDAAINGETGPVHLSIPVDILYSSFDLKERFEERPFKFNPSQAVQIWPDPTTLAKVAGLLAKAEKPIIIGGNGVWWAQGEDALRALAEQFSIPFYNMPYHQKLMGGQSEIYLGLADIHLNPPFQTAMQEADLAIVFGCRLDSMLSFGNPPFFPQALKLVTVNGSHQEYVDNHGSDLRIVGHQKIVAEELSKALVGIGTKNASWHAWLAELRKREAQWAVETEALIAHEDPSQPAHPLKLVLDVLDQIGEKDIVVFDGGDTHFWSEIGLQLRSLQGKHYRGTLFPGPYSLLGIGIPFATVARLLHPESKVILLSGDGAFLSGGLSIDVAFDTKTPITIVVDNNRALGSIMQQQKLLFEGGASFKTRFRFIPFHALVTALGGHGSHVSDQTKIGQEIRAALQSRTIACVNVDTRSVISPLISGLADRRAKSSIE